MKLREGQGRAIRGRAPKISGWREGRGAPLVALHGFAGGGRDFRGAARRIGRRILAPDLPGHAWGLESCTPEECTMSSATRMLWKWLDTEEVEAPFDLLGYSLGGRTALHLAAQAPDRVRSLVLIGTTAGIPECEQEARVAWDRAAAERVEREGVESFLNWWADIPVMRSRKSAPSEVLERLAVHRRGLSACGLAASLRGVGASVMPPVWSELHRLTMPVLLIVGEEDHRYREIAARLLTELPNARLELIEGVGHAAHQEAEERVYPVIRSFLAQVESST